MKKILSYFIVLFIPLMSNATAYYVSFNTGADTNPGTSASGAFKTLAKATSMLVDGDQIGLNRGNVWMEVLRTNDKSNITIFAYGTGADPLITGYKNITPSIDAGSNRYAITIPEGSVYLNTVNVNGYLMRKGRTPSYNSADVNKGYAASYVRVSSLSNSLFVIGIPTGTFIAGDDAIIKVQSYVMQYVKIDSVKNDTAYFAKPFAYIGGSALEISPVANRYYFRTNRAEDCDQLFEWCFNTSTKLFTINLGASGLGSNILKVSVIDTGINCGSSQNLTITGIKVEGHNLYEIYSNNATTGVTVTGCTLSKGGGKGVTISGSQNAVISNCTFEQLLAGAVQMRSPTKEGMTVIDNTFDSIGMLEGMGSKFSDDYIVSYTVPLRSLVVARNTMTNFGHNGIKAQGSNVLIEDNYGFKGCEILADNGFIYMHSETYNNDTNRIIRNNIGDSMFGEIAGTGGLKHDVVGCVYIDGNRMRNIKVIDNTASNTLGVGYQYNGVRNLEMRGNISYNCVTADVVSTKKLDSIQPTLSIHNNIFYRFTNTTYTAETKRFHQYYIDEQLQSLTQAAMQTSINQVFSMDSNFYNLALIPNFKLDGKVGNTSGSYPLTNLSAWQVYSTQDLHSIAVPNFGMDSAILYSNTTNATKHFYPTFNGVDVYGNPYGRDIVVQPKTSLLLLYSRPFSNGFPTYKKFKNKN